MSKHGIEIGNADMIGDKYKVLTHVATGGMSEVYLVEEVDTFGRTWALKVANMKDKLAQTLVDETKILSELDHHSLPKVADFYRTDDYFYLVMEYAQGPVLDDYFEENHNHLPLDVIVNIGIQLCDCLLYLHGLEDPIIYRDIKPGNIILRPDGKIMLVDFGIARKFDKHKIKDTVRIGTVGFAAPEQFEKKQTDSRSDLYSLGALLFYLLSSGKYVYKAGVQKDSFMKRTPKRLKKGIQKLVAQNPDDRIQDAAVVKDILVQTQAELQKSAVKNKRSIVYTAVLSSIAIILTVFGIFLFIR